VARKSNVEIYMLKVITYPQSIAYIVRTGGSDHVGDGDDLVPRPLDLTHTFALRFRCDEFDHWHTLSAGGRRLVTLVQTVTTAGSPSNVILPRSRKMSARRTPAIRSVANSFQISRCNAQFCLVRRAIKSVSMLVHSSFSVS
jgi:hypothetical protein